MKNADPIVQGSLAIRVGVSDHKVGKKYMRGNRIRDALGIAILIDLSRRQGTMPSAGVHIVAVVMAAAQLHLNRGTGIPGNFSASVPPAFFRVVNVSAGVGCLYQTLDPADGAPPHSGEQLVPLIVRVSAVCPDITKRHGAADVGQHDARAGKVVDQVGNFLAESAEAGKQCGVGIQEKRRDNNRNSRVASVDIFKQRLVSRFGSSDTGAGSAVIP